MHLIIRFLLNILGLWLASRVLAGFEVIGGWQGYLVVGLVLFLLNTIAKPILKLIAFPLIIISLGLFIIVINALIIWSASWITDYLTLASMLDLLWATLIISAVNLLANRFK
jgi:putative membrane protein